jgi:membrane-bound lytic murein transglycosylase F
MTITTRLIAGALLLAASACRGDSAMRAGGDWSDIRERDTLVVLTMFNATSYFSYRGEPMGFEYELLREFADSNDVVLRTEVVADESALYDQLESGAGDVIAARLIPTAALRERVAFTPALYTTRPAVVQRTGPPSEAGLPPRADSLLSWPDRPVGDPVSVRARPIASPAELAGARVHVPGGSPYGRVVAELSDTLTGDIDIVELEGDSALESLVRQVARGEIELAVSQENLAQLTQSYFQNIEVRPAIGPTHPIAWAVRTDAPELRDVLARWISAKGEDGTIDALYQKYFIDRRGYRERVESEYLTSTTGRLSQYDPLFQRYAPQLGWDWRLLASQAYQESRFDATARSWAGAQGLLQLMPGTAREVGVARVNDPEQNVQGAIRYLQGLERRWRRDIADSTERLKFVLASYNTGTGHVQDAQRLTRKNGGDVTRWDDVAFWLLQKSRRAVYTDPVVRHGFSRGLEPVLYVRKILERFEHYRQFVPEQPAIARASP